MDPLSEAFQHHTWATEKLIRHLRGLPVRGQRTSTNARTRKGPRKTVGVQRNPTAKTGIH